jgi:hypothetical protein
VNSMSREQIAVLLGLCASYDQRTVGGADVAAWWQASHHAKWTVEDATAAVIHLGTYSTARITPAHITATVRDIRSDRQRRQVAEDYRADPTPCDDSGMPLGHDRPGRQVSPALLEVYGDAAEVACPVCAAPCHHDAAGDGTRCRHADGRLTRIPHLARIRAAMRTGP